MGEEIRMHDEQEAEKLLQQGLDLFGITEEDLTAFQKGDDRKKVIAWYIRKKTSVRVEWITERLKMGVTSNFSRYIRAVDESKEGMLWELKIKMTTAEVNIIYSIRIRMAIMLPLKVYQDRSILNTGIMPN